MDRPDARAAREKMRFIDRVQRRRPGMAAGAGRARELPSGAFVRTRVAPPRV